MARVHKLLLTLASSSALYSGVVPALGLGNISLDSTLNEPLQAQIQLLEAGGLSADDVRVRLASEADFARAGVERIFFLNDLRFTPLFKGNRSVIRVTSTKAIREPYLNFVIELARPGGKILREYTLLIDPPSSSAYRSVAELPSYAQPSARQARPAKPRIPAPVTVQGNNYTVRVGDSLWLIAKRLLATQPQRSQQALMDDILALNPQAFVGGDSGRLRLGVNLRLPDTVTSAVPEAHSSAALPAAPSAPAARPNGSAASAAPSASAGRSLSLTTATSTTETGTTETSTPETSAATALAENRMAVELAARDAETRSLQTSIQAMQVQLSALQEQAQIKDQQLELLRADLASSREQALAALAAAQLNNPGSQAASPATTVAPIERQGSLLLWLMGATGLLLGALATTLWRANGRSVRAADTQPSATPSIASALVESRPLPAAEAAPVPAPVMPAPASERAVSAPSLVVASSVALPETKQPNADALEGANIYIAYGRFSEALGVLLKGIQIEPQRLELRLRMLEVLGELGDGAGFAQEQAFLRQQGADPTQLAELLARFAHLRVVAPAVILDDALVLHDDEPSQLPQDDFQLNLEDLSLDADWDLVSPFKATVCSKTGALSAVANDPGFCSDLEHLPEVCEVQLEQDTPSPFAGWSATQPAQQQTSEAGFDAFAGESLKSLNKQPRTNLEHLAPNRENLVKLNKALAYIAQGNLPNACSILNEVISDGDAQQQQTARELLAKIA